MARYWTLEMGVPKEMKDFIPLDAVRRDFYTIIIIAEPIELNSGIFIGSVREERVDMNTFKWLNLAQMQAKYPEYLI